MRAASSAAKGRRTKRIRLTRVGPAEQGANLRPETFRVLLNDGSDEDANAAAVPDGGTRWSGGHSRDHP